MSDIDTDSRHFVISKKLVLINSLSSVAARILNVTVLLWMYQYLLNRVPPEEFAVYPVVTAIIVIAPLFFSLFTGGVSRYVVNAYAKGDYEKIGEVISSVFPFLSVIGLIFVFLGGLFSWNIANIMNIPVSMIFDARIMMFLLVFMSGVQLMLLPFGVGFHVQQRFVELNIIGCARDILRIILIFTFLTLIGAEVIWVVVATVIAEMIHIVFIFVRSRKLVPELRFSLAKFQWGTATNLVSFGLWTTLGQLGNLMYTSAATIILNKFGTGLDVTNYHLGATFFRQIQGTLNFAILPLQPAMTAMHATDDQSRLRNTVLRGGRYSLWISLLVACPLAMYSNEFVKLYIGDQFRDAATVIVLFMAIFPFTQPTALLPMTAMATARVKPFFVPALLSQVTGLIFMIYLTKYAGWGAFGAVLSLVVITVGSQLLYFWRFCLKIAEIPTRQFVTRTLVPGFAPAFFGMIAWGALKVFSPPASWLELGLYASMGGMIYVGVLLIFCLDRQENADLRSIIGRKKSMRLT